MSDEIKDKDLDQEVNALELFQQNEETREQAEKRAAAESFDGGAKIDIFKMPKNDTKVVRILPLKPGGERNGYEWPLNRTFLKIENPSDPKKSFNIPVVNVKQVWPEAKLSDPLDTFRALISAELKAAGREKDVEQLEKGGYEGGIKGEYRRVMLLIDEEDKSKIQKWEASYSQFKDIEDIKVNTWKRAEKRANGKVVYCPLSSPSNGHWLEITGTQEGKRTSYKFNLLSSEDDKHLLDAETATALMALPHLNEMLYVYQRYHLTASIEFMKQIQAKYKVNILDKEEMKEVIEAVEAVLPKDDIREFSLTNAKESENESGEGEGTLESKITIDDIDRDYEAWKDGGISDAEFRATLKQFNVDEELKISITRSTTIDEIMDAIDEAFSAGSHSQEEEEEENDKEEARPEPYVEEVEELEEKSEPETRSERTRRSERNSSRGERPGRKPRS